MNKTVKKRLLHEMLFARRFEDRCYEGYVERKIGGFLHLYSGQEACAIGVLEAAKPGFDYVISSYRDHIHAIKCGVDPKEVMAELYGKETGCCKGRGGSMHIIDVNKRFMGGYAIVGGPYPLAAGIAKGIKLKGGQEICICFTGDASTNQGTFHETMNMAKLWDLPVLFICENNLYGIATGIERSTSVTDIYKHLEGYGIESTVVNGQDIEEVYQASLKVVDYVRTSQTPFFMELKTYRYRGHSMSDSREYRTQTEEQSWMEKDPINILSERMIKAGELTKESFDKMHASVLNEIENNVVAFAEKSADPSVEGLTNYLFYQNDPGFKKENNN